ncbi:MAG TPA: HNH endonuclease [Caldisericia bacterium]|nr:HNH endonuclease [Caldisericia bacterium]
MLKIGNSYTNNDLCNEFNCSPQGGIRSVIDKSTKKRKTIVLISNHVKSIYNDEWVDNVLHYTGQGQEGDQEIRLGNKALAETLQNNRQSIPDIHLFEVFKEKQYTYIGPVKVIGYYESEQMDKNENLRKVYMFRLSLLKNKPIQQIENTIKSLNLSELKKLANKKSGETTTTTTTTTVYKRSHWIVEYTKKRANGSCELCGERAPFDDKKGEPFLEVHHIDWLSQGGRDNIENAVALCPNCHRKMHILGSPHDVNFLKKKKK